MAKRVGIITVALLAGAAFWLTDSLTGQGVGDDDGGCGAPPSDEATPTVEQAASKRRGLALAKDLAKHLGLLDAEWRDAQQRVLQASLHIDDLEIDCHGAWAQCDTKALQAAVGKYAAAVDRATAARKKLFGELKSAGQSHGKAPTAALTTLSQVAFAAALRRALGPTLAVRHWKPTHAERPPWADLAPKSRCPDVMSESWFVDVASAVAANDGGRYLALQARFVSAVHCAPTSHALRLARAIPGALRTASRMFGRSAEASVRRSLLLVHLNTLLNLWDAVTAMGPTPLHELLRADRETLKEIISHPDSPISQIGLVLQDRQTDRSLAFDPASFCEMIEVDGDGDLLRPDEGCLSVTGGLDALLDPSRLGMGSCGLADLLGGGFDPEQGYSCDENACLDGVTEADAPGVQVVIDGGKTPYETPVTEMAASLCDSGGGGAGADARRQMLEQLTCVSERINPGADVAACVARFTGSNHDPAQILQPRDPQRDAECGDPLARDPDCPPTDPTCRHQLVLAELTQESADHLDGIADDVAAKVNEMLGTNLTGDDIRTIGGAAIRNATIDNDCDGAACVEGGAITVTKKLLKKLETADDNTKDKAVNLMAHEAVHATIDELCEGPNPDAGKCGDRANRPNCEEENAASAATGTCSPGACEGSPHKCTNTGSSNNQQGGGAQMCPPEIGDCEDCTPRSAAMEAFYECHEAPDESRIEPPGNIDPAPWTNPDAPAWAECFADRQRDQRATGRLAMACASVTCPPDKGPRIANGICVCVTRGGGHANRRPSGCAWIQCQQGHSPIAGPKGACRCSDGAGSVGGVPATASFRSGVLNLGPCGEGLLADYDADEAGTPRGDRDNCDEIVRNVE